jgi:PHP family Zn ribbon phosphoesterase
MAEPKLVQVAINYNAGVKANLGKYESGSCSDSETRTYNVEGMPEDEVDAFLVAQRVVMKERVDKYVEDGYEELHS